METSNFTVVCHGAKRETLTGGTIMNLFPALRNFEKIPGKFPKSIQQSITPSISVITQVIWRMICTDSFVESEHGDVHPTYGRRLRG